MGISSTYDQWKTASPHDGTCDLPTDALEKAIRDLSEGRNLEPTGCWGLLSFDGKDADLDPEGCTGIVKIVNADEERVHIEAGGYKTLCDPTYECEFELTAEDEEAYSEWAHSIVCEAPYGGEWSGDDWMLRTREIFAVEWVVDEKNDEYDVAKTALRVVEKAKEILVPFRRAMRHASAELDKLQAEIRRNYKNKGTAD